MDEPPSIDPVAARRWAALPHHESNWLHEEVARRMAERLPWICLPVHRWVHWEPERSGVNSHQLVQALYPQAECFEVTSQPVVATDPAGQPGQSWLQRVGLARSRKPSLPARGSEPPEGGAELVWANMLLHQVSDPRGLMAAWLRALAVDGFLMFSCFGPDTLVELRAVYEEMGWPPAVEEFTDMHDWGDQLFRVGFADPVVDMEHITLTFDSASRLLQELRGLGRNLHPGRYAALRTPAWRERLERALDECLRPAPGEPLTLTFEIIYGHALRPQRRARRDVEAPPVAFSIDS